MQTDADKSHSRCTVCCCSSQISGWECEGVEDFDKMYSLNYFMWFSFQSVSEQKLS